MMLRLQSSQGTAGFPGRGRDRVLARRSNGIEFHSGEAKKHVASDISEAFLNSEVPRFLSVTRRTLFSTPQQNYRDDTCSYPHAFTSLRTKFHEDCKYQRACRSSFPFSLQTLEKDERDSGYSLWIQRSTCKVTWLPARDCELSTLEELCRLSFLRDGLPI